MRRGISARSGWRPEPGPAARLRMTTRCPCGGWKATGELVCAGCKISAPAKVHQLVADPRTLKAGERELIQHASARTAKEVKP